MIAGDVTVGVLVDAGEPGAGVVVTAGDPLPGWAISCLNLLRLTVSSPRPVQLFYGQSGQRASE